MYDNKILLFCLERKFVSKQIVYAKDVHLRGRYLPHCSSVVL